MEAMTAPSPMKSACMANAGALFARQEVGGRRQRKGSMLMLMEASITQSNPAAIHSADELGMAMKREGGQQRAREEVGATATQPVPRVVAQMADDGLDDQARSAAQRAREWGSGGRRRRGTRRSRSRWPSAAPSRTGCPGSRSSCSRSARSFRCDFT